MDGSKRMPRGRVSPVALLATVMAVVASLAGQHQCSPTASKPNLDEIEVKNIAYRELAVVANMLGYVELLGNDTIYLPLDARWIFSARLHDDHWQRSVSMHDDNVHFRIEYQVKDSGKSYEFTKMQMSVNDGTYPTGSYRGICNFDQQFVFSLPADSRYSCQKVIAHPCSLNGEPVANLVLKSLEIELDGDQEKTAKREFSKPAWTESCDQWKGIEQSI